MNIDEIRKNKPMTAKFYCDCGHYYRKKKNWWQVFIVYEKKWFGVNSKPQCKIKPL